jgi:ribosome recycling factor
LGQCHGQGVTVNDEIVSLVMEEVGERMDKAVAHARSDFASIRTGRASPTLVEKLVVDYHGTDVPLQQIAGFSVPEARQLLISPYDRSALPAVEKAIQHSNLGLTPSNDGNTIRLSFPPLTQERRKELVKVVRQMAEEGRVAVRNARRGARQELEKLEKEGELTADDLTRAEKDLDAMTRKHEQQVDEALAAKEKELLED